MLPGIALNLDEGSVKAVTDFQKQLQSHLEQWGEGTGRPLVSKWVDWKDGIYKDYRGAADDMVRNGSVKAHTQIHHLRSSQVFAFNLFLPFQEGRRLRFSAYVSESIGAVFNVDAVRLEWIPPVEVLDEPGGVAATAADVVLWGSLKNGSRAAVLIEVKLSEDTFSHCKGPTSRGNRRKDVCGSASLFFDDPSTCYLRRPVREKRDRRYWQILADSYGSVRNAFPNADSSGPCPFAGDMQQPMRNFAIARGIEQVGLVERAWFALCAHDDNPEIAAHWRAWQGLLPTPSMAPLIPASEIVSIGRRDGLTGWAAYMRDRYLLSDR